MEKWEAKDKRISTLAFFRDLIDIKDPDKRLEKAMELSDKLYEKYRPFEASPELKQPIEKVKIIKEDEPPF